MQKHLDKQWKDFDQQLFVLAVCGLQYILMPLMLCQVESFNIKWVAPPGELISITCYDIITGGKWAITIMAGLHLQIMLLTLFADSLFAPNNKLAPLSTLN